MTYVHTTPWALYNEIDEFAAAWLEQLITRRLIAPGVVDRRSIVDIRPDELRGFRQVHLFAGIGVWSYAFRCAGISDDTEAWSASCPCQPFSDAGEGGGMDDERHLWPHAHHLIRECRPRLCFGEQVASKDGLAWLDLVQADMEGTGYAFGAIDTCAAGFGAPHIRQRQYWFGERLADYASNGRDERSRYEAPGSRLAELGFGDSSGFNRLDNNYDERLEGFGSGHSPETGQREGPVRSASPAGELGGLAYSDLDEQRQGGNTGSTVREGLRPESGGRSNAFGMADTNNRQLPEPGRRSEGRDGSAAGGGLVEGRFDDLGLADDASVGWGEQCQDVARSGERSSAEELEQRPWSRGLFGHNRPTGPTNGFWSDVDWLHCRDERWRPVEPGTFPLAHGAAARVGRLRGYGNAINAEQAIGFLEAYFEAKAIEIETKPVRSDAGLAFEDLI